MQLVNSVRKAFCCSNNFWELDKDNLHVSQYMHCFKILILDFEDKIELLKNRDDNNESHKINIEKFLNGYYDKFSQNQNFLNVPKYGMPNMRQEVNTDLNDYQAQEILRYEKNFTEIEDQRNIKSYYGNENREPIIITSYDDFAQNNQIINQVNMDAAEEESSNNKNDSRCSVEMPPDSNRKSNCSVEMPLDSDRKSNCEDDTSKICIRIIEDYEARIRHLKFLLEILENNRLDFDKEYFDDY